MKQRQGKEEQEKTILDPNYYLPGPLSVPSYEEEPSILVNDLVPNLIPEKTRNTKQNKTVEYRRMVMEL